MTIELQLKRLARIRQHLAMAITHLDLTVELLEKDKNSGATENLEVADECIVSGKRLMEIVRGAWDNG